MMCLVRRGLVRLPRNRAAAPESVIGDLPLVIFSPERFDDAGGPGCFPSQCPVCLEDFDRERTISQTPCHHVYHTECLRGWLEVERRCPLCRHDLTEPVPSQAAVPADPPSG
eukprot:CAMPEP_0195160234 /NCGR_PEP_ID=MMETSP0448-20130528/186565_1 /TAXON_ID=66468 /ORGANISM="Heterocapsa triquestra, Strain CCMP 448" /LENGTH=111 /DNA_ID=CAMNT_0040199035 /DNA_START=390 /DNA_END=721 /DNA_ORIENTATION=+